MWDLVCLWNLAIVCCLLIWSSVISSQTTSDLTSAESSRSFFYLKQKRIDNGNKCFGIIIQLMNVNRNLICLCFRFRYRRRKKRVSISCWHLAPSAHYNSWMTNENCYLFFESELTSIYFVLAELLVLFWRQTTSCRMQEAQLVLNRY